MASIKLTATYLFILRSIKILLGIVTLSVTIKYFGVSTDKDNWVLVSTFMLIIISALWGPINEIFRTKFIQDKELLGENVALNKTASLVGFIFWSTLLLSVGLFLFSNEIAYILLPTQGNNVITQFIILFVCMLPSLIISEITSILISILNSYNIYYIPEIVSIFTGIITIIVIILLAPMTGIYSMLISQYIGIVILLIVIAYFVHKNNLNLVWSRFIKINFLDVKTFILFALPLIIPYLVGQANMIIEKYIAGLLGDGIISSVDYSRQFINLMQSVLSSILMTLMVPMLSKAYVQNNNNRFVNILKDNMSITAFILCIFLCVIVGATETVCSFFFLDNNVAGNFFNIIIDLTRYYGIAFVGIYFYIIFGMVLLTSGKSKLYAVLGAITQAIVIIMNIVFYRTMDVYIFPVSYGVAHIISAIIMFFYMNITRNRDIGVYSFKIVLLISIYILLFAGVGNITMDYSLNIQILFHVICMLCVSPIMAYSFGINVKPIVKKCLNYAEEKTGPNI